MLTVKLMSRLQWDARKARRLAAAGRFLEALAVAERTADCVENAFVTVARRSHSDDKVAEAAVAGAAVAGALTGGVLLELGDYTRAIPALEAAARMTRGRESSPGDARSVLKTYRLLARAHVALGDHEAAREALDAGLAILESGQAWFRDTMGRFIGAGWARRILEYDHERLEAMLELASSLIELDEADATKHLMDEVEAGAGLVAQKWRGGLRILVGVARARVSVLRGDFAGADRFFTVLLDPVPLELHGGLQAEWTAGHASVKAALGDLDAAQRLYESAVAEYGSMYDRGHPTLATARSGLADVYRRQGNGELARDILLDVAEIDQTLVQVVLVVCDQQRLRYLGQVKQDLDRLLSLVVATPPDQRVGQRVFDVVLRRKALAFEVERSRRETASSVVGGDRAAWDALMAVRARIGHKVLAGPGAEGRAEHDLILAGWERDRDEREADLVRSLPLSMTRLSRLDAAGLGPLIPRGAILVEVVDAGSEYIAFVCDEQGTAATVVRLGATATIDPLIGQLLTALSEPPVDADAAVDELGRDLAALLLDPLRDAAAAATRWIVAPDGLLAALPLEILPVGQGRRLCDDIDLTYLTAARDLISLAERVDLPTPSAPIVGGAPDYDLGDVAGQGALGGEQRFPLRFEALPHTEAEAVTVAGLLGVPPLLAGAVVKDVVVRGVSSNRGVPQVLHLATHGYSIPAPQPRRPHLLGPESNRWVGLALAGANAWACGGTPPPQAGNGLLSADDVLAMDLHGTELVTLSACATGMGQPVAGEGLFGLRRSFLVAGAQSLVVTAWNVPDRATATFMEHFYSALIDGASKLHALQHARTRVRQQRPNIRSWGAFTLLGESGPLRTRWQRGDQHGGVALVTA